MVAAKADDPVVNQGANRKDGAAVLKGFPHFDRRSHRCFGDKCDYHIDFATHLIVAKKSSAALVGVVVQRVPMIGERIVNVRSWKQFLEQTLEPVAIVLIVHHSSQVRTLHDASDKETHA